ncbi:hypothetical protein JVT61DRAFT_9948 [Boletus reticuloceps]|uniref:DUF6532 domain-containing protein n=1 Tax=Boletus reticuloceps TaxID=495285 RepID=A0A8I3A4D0_9AGAM|nr:hypothetical protein JVT61DRAFT_9948 [Boletus reticuloceps]
MTWHICEIKKVAQEIIPVAYNLVAPKDLTSQSVRLEFIKGKAAALLQGSQYLKGASDDAGHPSHFAYPTLKSICHMVFYRNFSRASATSRSFTQQFQKLLLCWWQPMYVLCCFSYISSDSHYPPGSHIAHSLEEQWL